MQKLPVLASIFVMMACTPSQEATRVPLGVVLDGSGITETTNDAGWTVTLTTARVAASNLQFSIQGEMHAATASLGGWIVARAWAHPGHYAGGDVTGELIGDFVLDWLGSDGMTLGTADMLAGDYNGMNFTFRAATVADGLAADDPLLGHTAQLAGVARKGDVEVAFTAIVDVDANTQLVGAPFEDTIDAGATAPIEVRFLPTDPVAGTSLFDGLDFAALDALDKSTDGVAAVSPGDVAHNILRRTLQSHVHYNASPK
ncbi:MAG TPA: hypothetical protein VGB85_18090 [Nannocystis sp.]